MNRATLRFNIIPILIGVIGLIIAFIIGVFIGGGEIFNLAMIFGAMVLVLILAAMRQHIWLLLPMFWGFTGVVSVLRVPFSVRDLTVLLVAAVSFALLALRIYKFKNRLGFLDFLLLLNLIQVGLVFAAHPTGLRSLSSETVGAKPYFNIAIATLGYFIVANQVIEGKLARFLPVLMLIPEAISSVLSLAVRAKPGLGYILGAFYSGFYPTFSPIGQTVERVSGTATLGNSLITALCSYYRPLTSLIRPIRLLLLLTAIALILVSGFRSVLIGAAAIFLIGSYVRKGMADVVVALGGMLLITISLVLINSLHPLPLGVQRTLSFLPGHWDLRAKDDASSSTEWRLEMWKDVPQSSRYIRNRIMGDGFGFSRAELQAIDRQRYATGEMSQEDFMIIGSFHNGPLSTIRFVGVVGLILYYVLLIYAAVYAWRLVRTAEGTVHYPLTLFVGLALIWEPFNYTLVFGGYDSGLPNTIFSVGMLKMIHNSLRQNKEGKRSNAAPRLSPVEQGEPILS